jgi:hypothetical protein
MKTILIIFLLAGFGCFCIISYMTVQGTLSVLQFIALCLGGMATLIIVTAFISNHLSTKSVDTDIQSESYNQK